MEEALGLERAHLWWSWESCHIDIASNNVGVGRQLSPVGSCHSGGAVPADAPGLPEGTPGGGAALEGFPVPTHRAYRRCLREPVCGEEVSADRHGVVSSLRCPVQLKPVTLSCLCLWTQPARDLEAWNMGT